MPEELHDRKGRIYRGIGVKIYRKIMSKLNRFESVLIELKKLQDKVNQLELRNMQMQNITKTFYAILITKYKDINQINKLKKETGDFLRNNVTDWSDDQDLVSNLIKDLEK